MRDSRIGVFGAVGIILFLMLEVAAVSGIDARARWRALLVAPVVGRAMPPLLARMFGATLSGHGARFRAELGAAGPAIATVLAIVVAIGVLGGSGVLALVIGIGLTTALGAVMTRRLGGVSGDVHGAAVELA